MDPLALNELDTYTVQVVLRYLAYSVFLYFLDVFICVEDRRAIECGGRGAEVSLLGQASACIRVLWAQLGSLHGESTDEKGGDMNDP